VGLALESPAACRGLTGAPSGKLYIGSIEPRHGAGDPARGLLAAGRPRRLAAAGSCLKSLHTPLIHICRSLPTLSSHTIEKEGVMVACILRSFAVALLITVLPMGFAFAGGHRGGAFLGVGPDVGSVGGTAAGSMAPGLNSMGAGSSGNGTNAPGIPRSGTQGGESGGGSYGGYSTGIVPAPPLPGGAPPPASTTAASPNPSDNKEGPTTASREPIHFQGLTGDEPFSLTGLSRPGPDGSTVIVNARPCGLAAHGTDGTTTCVGIPNKRQR
jgi:hypothetical protein